MSNQSTRFSEGQEARIPVSVIRCDGDTQVRAQMNPEFLSLYTRLVADAREEAVDACGANDNMFDIFKHPLPPADVFFDGDDFWMADGFTRLGAYKAANVAVMPCIIHLGDARAARFFATGANKHGQAMTDADRRRAATMLLKDPEWCQWSDREIERRTSYGRTSVAKLRAEILTHVINNDEQPTKRKVSRGGKEYEVDVSNVRQSNSNRGGGAKNEAAIEEIAKDNPELAAAVRRKEITIAGAQAVAAKRRGDAPVESSGDKWYEDLPIYRNLLGKDSCQILIRDLEGWKSMHEGGIFSGLSQFTTPVFKLDTVEYSDLTPLSEAIYTLVKFPHPKDWVVCPDCKGDGCERCGGAGYTYLQ